MTQRLRLFDERSPEEASDEGAFPAAVEPSWFLHPANQQPREELVARYRQSRNLPEHPYRNDAKPVGMTPEFRELVSSRPRPPARFLESQCQVEPEEIVNADNNKHGELGLKRTFALAALMAIVSGATVGFLNSQFDTIKNGAFSLMAGSPVPIAEIREYPHRKIQAATAVDSRKPVATATLQVFDAAGHANSLIPLLLRAEPAVADQDIFLKISGLPEMAYLTTGKKDSDKVWALTIDDLRDLKLMIPTAQVKQLDLAVAAFEKKTGELAAPIKTMTIALSDIVVQPAAAPPPNRIMSTLPTVQQSGRMAAIPTPSSMSFSPDVPHLSTSPYIVTGDDLLSKGDLDGARSFYEQAWASGSADGAFGLARSYDPVVLASLKLKGANPDRTKALAWYEHAAAKGKSDAMGAIIRLRMKPQ